MDLSDMCQTRRETSCTHTKSGKLDAAFPLPKYIFLEMYIFIGRTILSKLRNFYGPSSGATKWTLKIVFALEFARTFSNSNSLNAYWLYINAGRALND